MKFEDNYLLFKFLEVEDYLFIDDTKEDNIGVWACALDFYIFNIYLSLAYISLLSYCSKSEISYWFVSEQKLL